VLALKLKRGVECTKAKFGLSLATLKKVLSMFDRRIQCSDLCRYRRTGCSSYTETSPEELARIVQLFSDGPLVDVGVQRSRKCEERHTRGITASNPQKAQDN